LIDTSPEGGYSLARAILGARPKQKKHKAVRQRQNLSDSRTDPLRNGLFKLALSRREVINF
jgi:hypothetical protein